MARITQQPGWAWELKSLEKRKADYGLSWRWRGLSILYLAKSNCNDATVNSNDV